MGRNRPQMILTRKFYDQTRNEWNHQSFYILIFLCRLELEMRQLVGPNCVKTRLGAIQGWEFIRKSHSFPWKLSAHLFRNLNCHLKMCIERETCLSINYGSKSELCSWNVTLKEWVWDHIFVASECKLVFLVLKKWSFGECCLAYNLILLHYMFQGSIFLLNFQFLPYLLNQGEGEGGGWTLLVFALSSSWSFLPAGSDHFSSALHSSFHEKKRGELF